MMAMMMMMINKRNLSFPWLDVFDVFMEMSLSFIKVLLNTDDEITFGTEQNRYFSLTDTLFKSTLNSISIGFELTEKTSFECIAW